MNFSFFLSHVDHVTNLEEGKSEIPKIRSNRQSSLFLFQLGSVWKRNFKQFFTFSNNKVTTTLKSLFGKLIFIFIFNQNLRIFLLFNFFFLISKLYLNKNHKCLLLIREPPAVSQPWLLWLLFESKLTLSILHSQISLSFFGFFSHTFPVLSNLWSFVSSSESGLGFVPQIFLHYCLCTLLMCINIFESGFSLTQIFSLTIFIYFLFAGILERNLDLGILSEQIFMYTYIYEFV